MDDKSAALLNINSFRVHGAVREAWAMISFAQTQHINGKPYSRAVWKWVVDCTAHSDTAGSATLYAVNGTGVDVVGTWPSDPIPSEPVPNSVADAVVTGVCSYNPNG